MTPETDHLAKVNAFYDSKKLFSFLDNVLISDFLHVGLYDDDHKTVDEASLATIKKMIRLLPKVNKSTRFLELGAGRGGTARFIVDQYGSKVDCINLSKNENKWHEKRNSQNEVYAQSIKIQEGNYEDMLFESSTYDFVLAQDSFLHSPDKQQIFRQITRTLKPEGRLVFTDIMKTGEVDEDWMMNIEEMGFANLGTMQEYKRLARTNNLYTAYIKEMPEQLNNHLEAMISAVKTSGKNLSAAVKKQTVALLEEGVKSVEENLLTWGILVFQKINT